jgi:putative FmdB family regulatory protein
MPIYEFECDNELCEANARYDKELSINEPHDVDCPFCGSTMRKIYSSVPVHFNGKGFYSTDSR